MTDYSNSDFDAVSLLKAALPQTCLNGATLWIENGWRHSREGTVFACHAPRDGSHLLDVALAGGADVADAVASSRRALPGWRDMEGGERAGILRNMAACLEKRAEAFALVETIDSGRAIRDTQHAAKRAAAMFHFFSGITDKIRGKTVPAGAGRTAMVEYEPYGVISAVTPWNYPLGNAVTKLAPALACGNTVVLKPAELTPLVTLLLAEVMMEAGLPSGVVNIITGDGATGAALVADQGIDKVSFTGSTATGRKIARSAGENLKGCLLELGGKSPLIVFDDADIESAVDAAVFTTFMNEGQTCTSCNRVLVASVLHARFAALCAQRLADLRIGDPLNPNNHIGAVVSPGQVARMSRLTETAKSRTMELPAFRPVEGGSYFRPLIIDAPDPAAAYLREEVFGPVMTVQSFDTDEEAYRLANDTGYGLAASVWTSSLARAETARRVIEAGVVWVNCVNTLTYGTPIGGHKSSGMGSEYGLEVIDQYMRIKTTVQMYGGWTSPFRAG
jgi:acyl-CoA reductase-like NAD-dependent aldehyde dehydrogenase